MISTFKIKPSFSPFVINPTRPLKIPAITNKRVTPNETTNKNSTDKTNAVKVKKTPAKNADKLQITEIFPQTDVFFASVFIVSTHLKISMTKLTERRITPRFLPLTKISQQYVCLIRLNNF